MRNPQLSKASIGFLQLGNTIRRFPHKLHIHWSMGGNDARLCKYYIYFVRTLYKFHMFCSKVDRDILEDTVRLGSSTSTILYSTQPGIALHRQQYIGSILPIHRSHDNEDRHKSSNCLVQIWYINLLLYFYHHSNSRIFHKVLVQQVLELSNLDLHMKSKPLHHQPNNIHRKLSRIICMNLHLFDGV